MTTPTLETRRSRLASVLPRDLGILPVVGALILIAIVFQIVDPAYLSSRNLSNLALQTVTMGVLTVGIVLVLVAGEIDLSIGAVSGLAATAMAITSTLAGWPAWAALASALAVGLVIGLIQGSWITYFGAPSFIVTLAGLLAWQGLQLLLLSEQNGQIRITDPAITAVASTYLPPVAGWILAAGCSVVAASWVILRRLGAIRSGETPQPLARDITTIVVAVALACGVTAVLNASFGVPVLMLVLVAVAATMAIVTKRTIFGRHLFAVGGNAEAARRTGIRVRALVIVVFMLASGLAALAGILDGARTFSVSANTGGGNAALNAIAAAVIGGTSLFGGRGSIVGAILGALVITSIQNGLALAGQTAATQVIATGIILLAAITIDVTSRRRLSTRK
jgi:D-xylose transport system permease protein